MRLALLYLRYKNKVIGIYRVLTVSDNILVSLYGLSEIFQNEILHFICEEKNSLEWTCFLNGKSEVVLPEANEL